ncbi:MAG: PEGA domain-containing protein [Proteobacteria bacterium]|nr:PEGA domain-containing protein [Pseudomonadota bacterium]
MALDARHRFRWSSARMACGAVLAVAALAGCVRREIEVTSTPPGALLTLNGREIGRTPAKVQFTFDGTYDVRLKLSGYESVEGKGTTDMPVWDFMGADLVAEVVPVGLERHERWHFDMVPEGPCPVSAFRVCRHPLQQHRIEPKVRRRPLVAIEALDAFPPALGTCHGAR